MREMAALGAAVVCVALAASAHADDAPMERLTLATAVQRALAKNPSALVAAAEIRRLQAVVREVRAQALPTLAGVGAYTRLDADRTIPGAPGTPATVISAADQFNASLLLTVPLIAPKQWAAWSHAADDVEAQRWSSADVRRQLAVAVGRAYLAVVAQKRVVEIDGRARDTAKAHFDYAETRFSGGVGNKIDAVRAAQELASDEAEVENAEAALLRAREALGVATGGDAPIDAAEEARFSGLSLAAGLSAVSARDDVRALVAKVKSAEHQVRDDWTDYAPFITGTFQPFYQTPPTLTLPQTGWQATLVLTLPLYDGGLRYGLAEERDAKKIEARAVLDAALMQAKSDVRVAFEAVRRADSALNSARRAADLAHQALELANLAYHTGATTNLEVVDAERRARDADTAVAVAEDASRQSRLDMLAATGRFP